MRALSRLFSLLRPSHLAPTVTWRGGIFALLLVAAVFLSGRLEWLELRALDEQFELRGPRAPRTPIVVVAIAEDSFDELNLAWPWPRALHGQLVETLQQ